MNEKNKRLHKFSITKIKKMLMKDDVHASIVKRLNIKLSNFNKSFFFSKYALRYVAKNSYIIKIVRLSFIFLQYIDALEYLLNHNRHKETLINILSLPFIDKICINVCLGKKWSLKGIFLDVKNQLFNILNQNVRLIHSKIAEANFNKLKKGEPLAFKATLRSKNKIIFLEKLLWFVLFRQENFEGLNVRSISQEGNFSLGIKDQLLFPSINFEDIWHSFGMDVHIICKNNISTSIHSWWSFYTFFSLYFPFNNHILPKSHGQLMSKEYFKILLDIWRRCLDIVDV